MNNSRIELSSEQTKGIVNRFGSCKNPKEAFRKLIGFSGMTISDLVRETGLTASGLYRAYQGKRLCSIDQLAKITSVVDLTCEEVFYFVSLYNNIQRNHSKDE